MHKDARKLAPVMQNVSVSAMIANFTKLEKLMTTKRNLENI